MNDRRDGVGEVGCGGRMFLTTVLLAFLLPGLGECLLLNVDQLGRDLWRLKAMYFPSEHHKTITEG